MNRISIIKRLLTFTLIFFTSITTLLAQTELKKHVVKSGETLYRLSVNYGITVNEILRYNPGLDEGGLKAGNTVLIPVIGVDSKEPSVSNNTTDKIFKTHKVKRKETLWSIATKYDITVQDLKTANPEMFADGYELKKGSKINIPDAKQIEAEKKAMEEKANRSKGYATVKVALLLPFCSDAAGSERCIEYYRGFLMSVEKMQSEGKNVEIYAFNETHPHSNIITILEQIRKKNVHLLIGPLYFEHFGAVSSFSKTNKIKTMIPFSSKTKEINDNPYLFLLNAPEFEKNEFASTLFLKYFSNMKTVFVSTDSRNERNLTRELRNKLIREGHEIGDITLSSSNEQILAVCNTKKLTIFVPDGSSQEDFQHCIAKLTKFKNAYPQVKTAFFGYPEWQKYAYTHRNDFHLLNAYIYSNAFFNPWSETTNALKAKYTQWFKSEILDTAPRMFMLGYDSGLTFINGLSAYGKDFGTQDQKLPLQQSDIVFKKISATGGYINGSMWFIHYRPDYQIEKVSEL